MNYSIRFLPEGKEVLATEGATLLETLTAAGLTADAPCGGKGICGKCAVEIRRAGEAAFTRALACRTRVDSDMTVRRLRPEEAVRVMIDGAGSVSAERSLVRAVRLKVEACPRGQSIPDWARLCAALDAELGRRAWEPSVPVCSGLGRLLREVKGEVWAVCGANRILEVTASEPFVCMAAFDLGTTTIAGYLMDAASGKTLAAAGALNPQARYGADVISRADHALSHGTQALSGCVREAMDELLGRMCETAAVRRDQIYAVMLAGNTAMHHLFLGISPDPLVKAPYNPVLGEPLTLAARDYGLRVHPAAQLFALPVIGGFVGADTVACLISGDWLHRDKLTLLIDIGTNGELVMGNRHRRIACSTAAGPALEGAKISCGMRAADGAIDRVWLENGALRWHVIGACRPKGLCGSGLVDLIAALLETGAIEDSGRLRDGGAFALEGTDIRLTQKDVREVQLAKAAIAAGIRLLAERLGKTPDAIEEVDIAGAFGNYINPDSACAIGLIPAELRSRIVPVGNAAGKGAQIALADEARWADAGVLASGTEFLELATLPDFQDQFVDHLNFGDDDDE